MPASGDEVDRIVQAWRRERPDLDVRPLEVLSRVSRLARHLDLARRRAFGQMDLEAWEFDVLSALRRAGAPYELTPTELVRQTLVTSGTMTNRLSRLTERGFVTRAISDADHRSKLVRLTDDGRRVVDGAMQSLVEDERELLASLPSEDQERLAGLLKELLRPYDRP